MLKNYLSLFFLSVSTLMMLGHSIFPHHHHGNADEFHHNHHSHQGEVIGFNSADHHGLLDNVFSFVPHGQKGVECISCPNMDETFNKQYFDFQSNDTLCLKISFPVFVVNKQFFDPTEASLIVGYFPPGGLRAPPFFT
ncbi:hypothetical protein [Cognataquiflexum rubidum]|uniref:hypothetical protein n=1 Tax=Cognataquiflexum rubidum TaxID=2922273 RepID=UPI001F147B2C|nr:hypothetical protein [Cognataquiflexum rubidum]MCH6235183.1 hypothetical protein [Cognataquiflexum rubidum]